MDSAIVFVHGLFQGFSHLPDFEFPGPNPLFLFDLLGYGQHADVRAPERLDPQVEHVLRLLDQLGDSRVTIVGHSVGGAVVMLTAARYPNRIDAVVNIEGNFTLADAFWSSTVAAMTPADVDVMLAEFRSAPEQWLRDQDIEPTRDRLAWTSRMFAAQPASTVHATAKAVVSTTAAPDYLPSIARVFDRVPVHLVAGERSRSSWSVPDDLAQRAASFRIQRGTGHMMALEDPRGFLRLIGSLVH